MDVPVRDEPAGARLREMHQAGDAPVVDRQPCVRPEIEAVPLLPKLALGPVGAAVDSTIG